MDPLLTEDRGDGRSRVHQRTVRCSVTATVTIQRDHGCFIAQVRRAGMLYPRESPVRAETPDAAIDRALGIAGFRREGGR